MIDRRTFLKSGTLALLGWRAAAQIDAGRRLERIGLQLYTVRDAMQRDLPGTLARVAKIGYHEVEFAGYFDQPAKRIRELLETNGLVSPSAHIPIEKIRSELPQVLEAAAVIGHRYVVCPAVDARKTLDDWKRHAELFNRTGEAARKADIQFAYHNHEFEFEPIAGKLPYDVLLAETDPKLVQLEMDLYWITLGRQDPLAYFERHPGRFPMVHVKDMDRTPTRGQTNVGRGIIDFKRIFARAEQAGIRHFYVEHDQPGSPFESIRISFEYLKALRF